MENKEKEVLSGLNFVEVVSGILGIIIIGCIITLIALPIKDLYEGKKAYDKVCDEMTKAIDEKEEYENSLKFSEDGTTVEVPVEKGSDKYITMDIAYDSHGNEYFVNPTTREYKLFERQSNIYSTGGLFPSINRINAPLPWGEKGVLKEGQEIADK